LCSYLTGQLNINVFYGDNVEMYLTGTKLSHSMSSLEVLWFSHPKELLAVEIMSGRSLDLGD